MPVERHEYYLSLKIERPSWTRNYYASMYRGIYEHVMAPGGGGRLLKTKTIFENERTRVNGEQRRQGATMRDCRAVVACRSEASKPMDFGC